LDLSALGKCFLCALEAAHSTPRATIMGENESIEVQGVVIETLPNAEFNVELKNGHRLLGRISEEMKHKFVTILPGDVVTIVLSPEDLNLGRIVCRASS
jgi:translation initiation factor IF-1